MSDLAKALKEIDTLWTKTEAMEMGSFSPVPDGDYVAYLFPARLEFSKQSNRFQIAWPLKVAIGKLKGRSLVKFDGLDHETSIGWIKGVFKLLGIEIPASSKKIPAVLETYFESNNDVLVNITVKTKDTYTNIFINGIYAGALDETSPAHSEEHKEIRTENTEKSIKEPEITTKQINKMSSKEIKNLIKDRDLDLDSTDFDDIDDLKEAVISELGLD